MRLCVKFQKHALCSTMLSVKIKFYERFKKARDKTMRRVRARRASVAHKSRADGTNWIILNKQGMKFSAIMRGFISLVVRFCLCAVKFFRRLGPLNHAHEAQAVTKAG